MEASSRGKDTRIAGDGYVAQNRSVVIEVFHAKGGYPLLIHTAATPRRNRV